MLEENETVETVTEGSAGEATLRPGGGSAGAGDLKMKTLGDIVSKLISLPDDDLNGFKKSLERYDPSTAVGSPADANKNSIAAKPSAASIKQVVKEDLEKVFSGQDSLSEDFIDRATILFEAAVTTRVDIELEQMQESFDAALVEKTDVLVEEFSERLDSYLAYVAEEWMKENKLAVDAGIKTELTESFLKGLHTLFTEHYVEVPEDKVDVVAALAEQVDTLTEQLNTATARVIQLTEGQKQAEASNIVNNIVEGMTEVDADRLKTLAEDLDYTDLGEFEGKVKILKDTLFTESTTPANTSSSSGLLIEEVGLTDVPVIAEETKHVDPRMQRYSAHISRAVKAEK